MCANVNITSRAPQRMALIAAGYAVIAPSGLRRDRRCDKSPYIEKTCDREGEFSGSVVDEVEVGLRPHQRFQAIEQQARQFEEVPVVAWFCRVRVADIHHINA